MDNKKNKPLVAILYIATGRYIVFWQTFYESAEQYLLPDCNKHYFLFTDNIDLSKHRKIPDNVTIIKQEALKWPYSTLMRFKLFLDIEDTLKKHDYIFFFNANTEFLSKINSEDLLPLNIKENFTLCLQPHLFHLNRKKYTYDRNPESKAYIPYNCGQYYFTGALNGGKSQAYLSLCHVLYHNTLYDLEKNTIALWHDESHLNNFALGRNDIKILPPYFTRGEVEIWKKTSKIMFSDKTHFRFGGHSYLRCETNDKITQEEWTKNNAKQPKRLSFRAKQYIASVFLRL